ncbi:MAG: CPBP family intramembrane glutamic endopeptidase [Thermodesulfobacteriota bacterium]
MASTKTEPHISRMNSLITIVTGSLLFALVVVLFNMIGKMLFGTIMASGLRARVTIELTNAMLSEIVVLVLLVLYLKHRGIGLRQIGLWGSSPAWGWISAAMVAGLFIWFNLALPLRNEQNLGEVSLFHIYNSLTAGVIAGFVEEIFFRGFFMTELAWAGFGRAAQVTISAVLYGLVHSAWGFTSGMFTMQMMGGAIIGTAIFGVSCSIVYLVSRRSLMPVIIGHAAIDFVIEPWLFMVAITMTQVH